MQRAWVAQMCMQQQLSALWLTCCAEPWPCIQATDHATITAAAHRQQWLTHEGSPMSHVERADFSDERDIDSLEFSSFDVRR